jgi:hypothetical protein
MGLFILYRTSGRESVLRLKIISARKRRQRQGLLKPVIFAREGLFPQLALHRKGIGSGLWILGELGAFTRNADWKSAATAPCRRYCSDDVRPRQLLSHAYRKKAAIGTRRSRQP